MKINFVLDLRKGNPVTFQSFKDTIEKIIKIRISRIKK